MGGRWTASVVVSMLTASTSAFVSCPSSSSSRKVPVEAASWHHPGSFDCCSSSSSRFGCGFVATAWWASRSLPARQQSRSSRLLQPLANPRRRRRRRSCQQALPEMSLQLETAVPGQQHKYEVVFVRHGQSTWNKANRFIGWTDAELTEEGEIEARVAGQLLLSQGFEFDVVYTSMLKRAIKTAWVVLDELNQQHVPVTSDWRLNERCYGALVGREKKECVRMFGADQVKLWRRSWDVPPPAIDKSSKLWPGNNPKYKFLMADDGESQVPVHESLKDVMARSSVYWEEVIAPAIRAGKRVCVCGHENNLRSLLKYLDGISNEDIVHVELPRAVPLVYYLNEDLQPVALAGAAPHLSGEYVGDPEAIAAIQERDLKNVYDLSVSKNLEELGEPRFAAKLEELARPCEVDDEWGDAVGDDQELWGTFLETGVGEDTCRASDITSKPLFLYNCGAGKSKRGASSAATAATGDGDGDRRNSNDAGSGDDEDRNNGDMAEAQTLALPAPTEQKRSAA